MRDIEDYSKKYAVPGFEKYNVFYRKKKLLEVINDFQPQNILEIGCGSEPLFLSVPGIRFTVIEPSSDFYNNAVKLSEGDERITCIEGFFEDVSRRLLPEYDIIICASLLHEVEDPESFLLAVTKLCNENTIVHIIVPNANSMHRLLGMEMGMIADPHEKSQNNKDFQQNNVFDRNSLRQIAERNGLEVTESGSFFVKPFSHGQMYEMMEKEILNESVLDGLYHLTKYMPEFGSEIYVNCKLRR